MKPLLKNLMGNGSKDQEMLGAMKAVLAEFQRERERYEALIEGSQSGADRLRKLGEPLAEAEKNVDGLGDRMATMETRFQGIVKLSAILENLEERAEGLTKSTQWAESRLSTALQGSQQIESSMAELVSKVDLAADLKERLTGFLEVEKPFQLLRGDAASLRGELEGAVERMARLRDQHDRLLEAHKTSLAKLEAMDRRRDEMGRSLSDKERRIELVEDSVRSLDGVQARLNDVKRDLVTLKALGDSVAQKTAALEAHREALDRALAQTEHLDRAMRNIEAGMRQQKENEKSLSALAEQVDALKGLHESVLDRSNEVTQLQREAHEQTIATRQSLTGMSDEMKRTVERFDFEARGLESVSQRIADLRGELTASENRFKTLSESSLTMGEIKHQVQGAAAQLLSLSQEIDAVGHDMAKLQAMRHELESTAVTARTVSEQVNRLEASRDSIDAGLRDLAQLSGARERVQDALEQMTLAHGELARVRETQGGTKQWLDEVVASVADLRQRFMDLRQMEPVLETVQKQAQRLQESTTGIDARREFVDGLHQKLAELGSLTARMDERGQQLSQRMEAAEQRFVSLGDQAETAELVARTIADVTAKVEAAESMSTNVQRNVAAAQSRCESVEAMADATKSLQRELEQRHRSVEQAAKALEQATTMREEAANAATQLESLSDRLHTSLEKADGRVLEVDELTRQIEARVLNLRKVEQRLGAFETRMAKWDVTEQEIARSLEQIASRQGTIDTLQNDLERMFAMAERTSTHVREITSAHHDLEDGRESLNAVLAQLEQLKTTRQSLDERKRQIGQAEERLSRADALLVEVRSSLEVLEGQKVLVDQAVEKAGSLQSLVRQAEAAIDTLRETSQTSARMRGSNIVEFPYAAADDDEDMDQAATGTA